MKYLLITILLISLKTNISGQQKLYYFINSDSTAVGVKNDAGKIIIPAKFSAIVNYDFYPIVEPTIEFLGISSDIYTNIKSPAMPVS